MSFQIIGSVDEHRLFCAGSFTKLLTSYVCLSRFAEQYDLKTILDDDTFFDRICTTPETKEFLTLFQHIIGNHFSLHDICSYYAGLPYTFDVSQEECEAVDAGQPFKHHSIVDEITFLDRCRNNITPVYTNRCKFHYSEISIIFLGYLVEKLFNTTMEHLYQQYLIAPFSLRSSQFSRTRLENAFCQDLSDKYDYPSIAILDHGYFCYSNGFFTTLHDMKNLLDHLLKQPVFHLMTDITFARAASPRLLNGLTIELRIVNDDLIYGYEGFSYSGCNIWAYSTKHKKGYLTFNNSEEDAYTVLYGQLGYTVFDKVPEKTEDIYKNFFQHYNFTIPEKDIPIEFQGNYQRVNINEKTLYTTFIVGKNFILIRNPDEIKYEVMFVNGRYHIKCKDKVHGSHVGFMQAKGGTRYMYFDGTLYRQLPRTANSGKR